MGSSRGTVTYLYQGIRRIYGEYQNSMIYKGGCPTGLSIASGGDQQTLQGVAKDISHENKGNYPNNL